MALKGMVIIRTTRIARGPEGMDRWLTTREAARKIGVPSSLLDGWRYHEKGPPWEKVDGRIRYRLSEFRAWLATQMPPANGRRFRLSQGKVG